MDIDDILRGKGIEFELMPKKECSQLRREWLEKYNSALYERTGKWIRNGFMWEGLSENKYAIRSQKTKQLYKEQVIEQFYIFDEGCWHCYLCKATEYPEFENEDIYIFPVSKAWTMAFTHEGWSYFVT